MEAAPEPGVAWVDTAAVPGRILRTLVPVPVMTWSVTNTVPLEAAALLGPEKRAALPAASVKPEAPVGLPASRERKQPPGRGEGEGVWASARCRRRRRREGQRMGEGWPGREGGGAAAVGLCCCEPRKVGG